MAESVAVAYRKVCLKEARLKAGLKGKYLASYQKIVLFCAKLHQREGPAGDTSLLELPLPVMKKRHLLRLKWQDSRCRNELLKYNKSPAQCTMYIQENCRALGWKWLDC